MVIREFLVKLGFSLDEQSVRRTQSKLQQVAKGAQGAFQAIGGGLIARRVAGIGLAAIKTASSMQEAQINFETMLGSAEKAKKLIGEMIDFAAKTPFQLPDVQKNAVQLLAMGIEAKKLMPTMKSLGDVAAGIGRPLGMIAFNFGQVKTMGKLAGTELRDFARQGVPILETLAKTLGKTTKEIQAMVTSGDVTFEMVEQAFKDMTSEGGRFFNLMERRSKTLTGLWSNLLDATIRLRASFGEAIIKTFRLVGAIRALGKISESLTEWFSALNDGQQKFIILMLTLIGIVAPLSLALLGLISLITFIAGAVGLMGLAIITAIAAITGILFVLIDDFMVWRNKGNSIIGLFLGDFDEFIEGVKGGWEQFKGFFEDLFDLDKLMDRFHFWGKTLIHFFEQLLIDIDEAWGNSFIGKILKAPIHALGALTELTGKTVGAVENFGTNAGTFFGSGGLATSPEGLRDTQKLNQLYAESQINVNVSGNISEKDGTSIAQQVQQAVKNNNYDLARELIRSTQSQERK